MRISTAALIVFGLTSMCGMCSKDDKQVSTTPSIRYNTGLLATFGVNGLGETDSLCFRFSSSLRSIGDITDLSPNARIGGFVKAPRDLAVLESVGTNRWTITKNGGTGSLLKLGNSENIGGNFTDRHHLGVTTNKSSDSARFILHDAGDGAFYIESALKPGLHLITERVDVQPPSPRHETWKWDPVKKQKWFITPL
jgi:hypothetical protein